jgi:lipoic acid synthetase
VNTTENDKHRTHAGIDQKGAAKTARIPIKIAPQTDLPRKPAWIRAKAPTHPEVGRLKELLRAHSLHTVCEEATCPNLGECFSHGIATFMIMGKLCTRRCPFCDVAHGRPLPLDLREPENVARAIAEMKLKFVVITSVDRDDLRDGGAAHFAACIRAVRQHTPSTSIEILVPDFRGRMEVALVNLGEALPDIFNHNLETVPRLYKAARPGADYHYSLELLRRFKERHPGIPTKSGIMVGLGETNEEIFEVMRDVRAQGCDLLTIGQYLQPSRYHLPVVRFVTPDEFAQFARAAREMGYRNVASGPMVRSSYHAEQQAAGNSF